MRKPKSKMSNKRADVHVITQRYLTEDENAQRTPYSNGDVLRLYMSIQLTTTIPSLQSNGTLLRTQQQQFNNENMQYLM